MARHDPRLVAALRVNGPQGGERRGIERIGVPFALDGIHKIAFPRDDKVDFATAFVAPVEGRRIGQAGLKGFQNEVLPERAEVVGTKDTKPLSNA